MTAPNPDKALGYDRPLESYSVEWLASEVRVVCHQRDTLQREHNRAVLERARLAGLVTGLACIVRRLPKRPHVDRYTPEREALAWVETAISETDPYVPWHSDPPAWAPAKAGR